PAGQQAAHLAEEGVAGLLARGRRGRAGSVSDRRGRGGRGRQFLAGLAGVDGGEELAGVGEAPPGVALQAAQDQAVGPAEVVADLILHLRRRREAQPRLEAVWVLPAGRPFV